MQVSVVVPVRDDARVVDCVESVFHAAGAHAVEVIVVDNGSTVPGWTETLERLEALGARVISASGTVYAARNPGVRAASGPVVLFTDADCVVEPGWIVAALNGIERGFDLVQGFSGSRGTGWRDRLIQARYEAHLRDLPPGAPVECDTRNLAVVRRVLELVPFNEAYRRTGDTELGLRAEALGFRVGYCPSMRVLHAHDDSLALLVAKQVCHGWGAQRLARETPGIRFHGGHLRLAARWGPRVSRVPGSAATGRSLAAVAVSGARLLDSWGPHPPEGLAVRLLAALEKLGGLGGHLMFAPGRPEPSPSGVLKRKVARD